MKRPGLKQLLHQRPNESKNGTCDSMIYKSFTDNDGKPFFQGKRNIRGMFNVNIQKN